MTSPTPSTLRYRRDIRTPLLATIAAAAGAIAVALTVIGMVVLA